MKVAEIPEFVLDKRQSPAIEMPPSLTAALEPNPQRILIVGAARGGKTTLAGQLADQLGYPVKHTDDLIGQLEWSEASAKVAEWMQQPGPWIIEGVAGSRALRKFFGVSKSSPADLVIRAKNAVVPVDKHQAAMNKGEAKVWLEIVGELHKRKVNILTS